MAGRQQRHRHVADHDPFAISGRLGAARGAFSKPHLHHRERLARREHMLMPRPRMVRMAVRDNGAFGSAVRIDMKAAGAAIEAFADRPSARSRIAQVAFLPGCVEQITLCSADFYLKLQTYELYIKKPL